MFLWVHSVKLGADTGEKNFFSINWISSSHFKDQKEGACRRNLTGSANSNASSAFLTKRHQRGEVIHTRSPSLGEPEQGLRVPYSRPSTLSKTPPCHLNESSIPDPPVHTATSYMYLHTHVHTHTVWSDPKWAITPSAWCEISVNCVWTHMSSPNQPLPTLRLWGEFHLLLYPGVWGSWLTLARKSQLCALFLTPNSVTMKRVMEGVFITRKSKNTTNQAFVSSESWLLNIYSHITDDIPRA